MDPNDFHMDHFFPKEKGGQRKKNLVPSCQDCNLSKSNLSIEEFRDKINRLIPDTHRGRMISKYYGVKKAPIKFFFEEVTDGDIQNNINELLDR